jgi:archaemetzincin
MFRCNHERLHLDVSSHAAEAGFVRPPLTKRKAATTPSGRVTGSTVEHARLESLFPGPLVLPDDALAIDPKEPPQSLRSWITEKARNPITQRRKTVYVVPTPEIAPELLPALSRWMLPFVLRAPLKGGCSPPKAEHLGDYLAAFYHPLPVKLLSDDVRFVPWVEGKSNKSTKQKDPQYIGLQVGTRITRITTRPCPDEIYPRQLNLNDILDAAIESLPSDAYAMVMMTDHDLYEDDDDDFCCGRAYGGSRVAVVSSARYHPLLDEPMDIDREHAWPFSHCETDVQRLCRDAADEEGSSKKRRKAAPKRQPPKPSSTDESMAGVIKAGLSAPEPSSSLTGLWFSRVARTAAHEVGHCFCLGHCSYYACSMQGTAGMAEDLRQPPYLCLVCLAKLTRAVRDVEKYADDTQCLVERYRALAVFCAKWKGLGMFVAYRCWLEKRIEMLEHSEAPLSAVE